MFGHHETFSDIINLEGNHMHSELKGRTWKSEWTLHDVSKEGNE